MTSPIHFGGRNPWSCCRPKCCFSPYVPLPTSSPPLPASQQPAPRILCGQKLEERKSLFYSSRIVTGMFFGRPCSLTAPSLRMPAVGGRPSSKGPSPAPCAFSRQGDQAAEGGDADQRGFTEEEETFAGRARQSGAPADRGAAQTGKMQAPTGPAVAPRGCCAAALTFLAAQDAQPFPNLITGKHSGVCSVQPMVLQQMDPIKRPSWGNSGEGKRAIDQINAQLPRGAGFVTCCGRTLPCSLCHLRPDTALDLWAFRSLLPHPPLLRPTH